MADPPWGYGSVACKGHEALVRFTFAEDNASPDFQAVPAPDGVHFDDVKIKDPSRCRLSDGRLVELKHSVVGDAVAYGQCGADSTEIFSLWIAGAKIYSQEVWHNKCGSPYDIASVWLQSDRLTECRILADSAFEPEEQRTLKCDDQSQRLLHPIHDVGQPGSLKLIKVAPGMAGFCKSLIARQPPSKDVSPIYSWPAFAKGPVEIIDDEKERDSVESAGDLDIRSLDIDNNGTPDRVAMMAQSTNFFDGSIWVVVGRVMSDADVSALRGQLIGGDDPEVAIPKARTKGTRIFAGDQTPYETLRYVWIAPIVREHRVWLHAWWAIERPDLPSDVILRPLPSGNAQQVCVFDRIPLL